ncbi:Acetyltransferase (GNAT) family protein [Modestobacter sp. DSM 44400]|uniref:GNAT family N-acetyltransferase n=1 Tax=Modestobacter sp. DSM 44400 TaxID=1550230 RepID=UPI0008957205|nr:GNAT family N-acetyltransferase [Modestobacter sp. DSM 44400]SDY97610.1 Acetyltransferase (GNAT) family protein [Modestobacter sp. DSM 44400]
MIRPAAYDARSVRLLLSSLAEHYAGTYGAHDLDQDDPTDYRAPTGGVRLGYEDGAPVALACWRRHGPGVCELRRFYVVPTARGRGWARRLLVEASAAASAAGYSRAVCATVAGDGLAGMLGLDVRPIAPYGPYADLPGVGYFELAMVGAPASTAATPWRPLTYGAPGRDVTAGVPSPARINAVT